MTNFTDPIIDCKITLLSGLLCVLQCLLLIFQFFLLKMVAALEKTKCSSKFYVCSPETSVTSILLLFEKEKHQINKVFNFRAAIKSAPTKTSLQSSSKEVDNLKPASRPQRKLPQKSSSSKSDCNCKKMP